MCPCIGTDGTVIAATGAIKIDRGTGIHRLIRTGVGDGRRADGGYRQCRIGQTRAADTGVTHVGSKTGGCITASYAGKAACVGLQFAEDLSGGQKAVGQRIIRGQHQRDDAGNVGRRHAGALIVSVAVVIERGSGAAVQCRIDGLDMIIGEILAAWCGNFHR